MMRNAFRVFLARSLAKTRPLFTITPSKILSNNKVEPTICFERYNHQLQDCTAVLDRNDCADFLESFKNLNFSSQEEVSRTKGELSETLRKLNYDQLVELVKVLKNENWEQLLTHGLQSETYPDKAAKEMFEMIRLECNTRLKSRNVGMDKFISLSNENFEKVLELCHDWAAVEKKKSKGSFIYNVVNNIGDQQTATSSRRFKHFTRKSFVSFCILMREINLAKDFHSYYCIVKFVDLFPQMNQDDIGEVCHTFCVHGSLTPSPSHPMSVTLKTCLANFLEDNIRDIKSVNLLPICLYLGNNLPDQLVSQCLSLQSSMFVDGLMDKHDMKTLMAVAKITSTNNLFTRTGLHKDFWDTLVDRVLEAPVDLIDEQLTSKDISKFAEMLSLQRGTPRGRMAAMNLGCIVVQRLTQNPSFNARNCLSYVLNMAHMGMYDKNLLEKLFECEAITVPSRKDGGRMMSPNLRYGSIWHNNAGMDKGGGDLLQLKGMVELEMPEFKGKLLSEQDDSVKFMLSSKTPLEVMMEGENNHTSVYLEGYRVKKGLEVHEVLCRLWGDCCVWETYLLPFTGQINYVVRLNRDCEGIIVGKEIREQNKFEVKYSENDATDVWIAFYLVHPRHRKHQQARSGGPPVTQRLLRRLGFKGMVIDLEQWDAMDNTQRKVMLWNRAQAAVADS